MSSLSEVPTDELLSFQDYPTIHTTHSNSNFTGAQLRVDVPEENIHTFNNFENNAMEDKIFNERQDDTNMPQSKSFWTLEYYQQFFDVDSKDVMDRIIFSMFPRRDSTYKHEMKTRPDLYGPFWIAVTLVFTIAISGNIAKYLQHANEQIHWKYDFHMVSYAATAIFMYITVIPVALWALLKWSINTENLEDFTPPKILELVCFYGYSLFIYIPVSVLWTIQVNFLQWLLVAVATCLSGSVLLLALSPSIKLSRHKLFLTIGIILFHSLLAVGFMWHFFHGETPAINTTEKHDILQTKVGNSTH